MVLAKAYSSAEEIIEKVGETVSFATAVVTARALVNPDPTPRPGPGEKDTDGDDGPATIKPPYCGDGGNGSPTGDRNPPAPDSKGTGMLDDIIRVAVSGTTVSPQIIDTLILLGGESTIARIKRCSTQA